MATFIDLKQREWELAFDVPTVTRIRQECDPDFLKNDFVDPRATSTIERLLTDPVLLCHVGWLLCERQATERGIDAAGFYSGLTGEAIDRATDALVAAMKAFVPDRQGQLIDAIVKQDQQQQRAISQALEKFSDPQLQAEFDQRATAQIDALVDQLIKGK